MKDLLDIIDHKVVHRFWAKVNTTDTCWLWTAASKNAKFCYGYFKIGRKKYLAHRISWLITYGIIPNNLYVLHKCDNPKCVNPNHLFLGTAKDNCNDCIAKNRSIMVAKNRRVQSGKQFNTNLKIISNTLTQKQIEEIQNKYIPHNYGFAKLAKEYNVSKWLVRKILNI